MTDEFYKILAGTRVGGFLRAYVEHTRNMEAPTSFHFFTGLVILGAVIKRRVFFDQGSFKLFPCYQVLLAGPAGEAKKTTAAEYGVDMGRRSGEVDSGFGAGSPEALWDHLARRTKAKGQAVDLLYAGEMANLVNCRDYSSNMIELLMSLFECRDKLPPRVTITHKTQELKDVAVSALFCSNEDMLMHAMPKHAMKGGLPSRMIMVYEAEATRAPIPFPKKQPKPPTALDDLVAQLTGFCYLKGEVSITPAGEDFYEDWYVKLPPRRRALVDSDLKPFFSRYGDHMIRVGMGLAMSEMTDMSAPVVIDAQHFIQAEAVLEYVIERLPALYRFFAMGPFGEDYNRALKIIDNAQGKILIADWSRKLGKGRLSQKQTNELLETMIYNGDVYKEWEGTRQYILRVQK